MLHRAGVTVIQVKRVRVFVLGEDRGNPGDVERHSFRFCRRRYLGWASMRRCNGMRYTRSSSEVHCAFL